MPIAPPLPINAEFLENWLFDMFTLWFLSPSGILFSIQTAPPPSLDYVVCEIKEFESILTSGVLREKRAFPGRLNLESELGGPKVVFFKSNFAFWV